MNFTFDYLEQEIKKVSHSGYKFYTLEDYWMKTDIGRLNCYIRIDIDFSVSKAFEIAKILTKQGIKASFFVRLHAPEYNPFDFKNIKLLREISKHHEVGLHSEIIDLSEICDGDAANWLMQDKEIFRSLFSITNFGLASHGGLTGFNNLDFWNNHEPQEFGLKYEAYENTKNFSLFFESRYVSDSEWIRWKSYQNGNLLHDDHRSPSEHAIEQPSKLYLLLHGDTYYFADKYE